jgi:hypothetical protein
MAIMVKKTNGASKIDAGQYLAVIRSVVVETPKKPSAFNPDCDPYFKWTLRIYKPLRDGEEFEEPYENNYLTTMRLTAHPKNKLNNFLKAAGIDTEVDELDVETAVGKRVQVIIKDDETDQGTFSKIVDVDKAPVKKAAAAVAPKAATAPKTVVKKAAPTPPPAPVEELEEEDVAPPVEAAEEDELGDVDKWASLED